jgi:hypothetical protein
MGRLAGLTVSGVVKERRRRRVPLDNPQHEIVTYTLVDNNEGVYFVDDFEPDKYHNIGDYVMLPVYTLSGTVKLHTRFAPGKTIRPEAKHSDYYQRLRLRSWALTSFKTTLSVSPD